MNFLIFISCNEQYRRKRNINLFCIIYIVVYSVVFKYCFSVFPAFQVEALKAAARGGSNNLQGLESGKNMKVLLHIVDQSTTC